jgi:hypothetical protein
MTRFAFKTPFLIWLGFLMLCVLAVVWQATRTSQSEERKYQEIVASQPRKLRKTKLKEKSELTKQTRWDVQKKIWSNDGPLRSVMKLDAVRSELGMFTQKKSCQVIETFYTVRGVIQQELYYKDSANKEYVYNEENLVLRDKHDEKLENIDISELIPMQRFRYFEAEKAIYDFHTQSLIALDVQFWTFQVEGHDLCDNPLRLVPVAKGSASSMTMSEKQSVDKTQFYAENLKLEIKNERGLW